jgi:hypothetical protein
MIAREETIHEAACSLYTAFKEEYGVDSDIEMIKNVIADSISQFFDDATNNEEFMD